VARAAIQPPHFPIIYVRGYAGTEGEIEDTVADPYMGFNVGTTKIRQAWTGAVSRHYFESPVVRLMKQHGYTDVYTDGEDMPGREAIPARSIVVFRYYDQVSTAFGSGERTPIEQFGEELGELILRLRQRVCGDDPAALEAFRVYLVGHSMGGLIIRCMLQNQKLGGNAEGRRRMAEARRLVDKVFTYASPHNGIDFQIIGNVPAILTANDVNNFNRPRMADYLGLPTKGPAAAKEVHSLNGAFDPERFFCLIGTNALDYAAANGWSTRAVGPYSDGLVRINNAFVTGPSGQPDDPVRLAPRAYVHRSHSGHFGIVNSEEGYQNLTRFLFGDVRVDGVLDVHSLSLPASLEKRRAAGEKVRASYHFEAIARVRGVHWDLSRRVASEHSTVFRRYDELFPDAAKLADPAVRRHHERPHLFTAFLSSGARVEKRRRSLGFSLDLGVLVPTYEVDGVLWLKDHFDGGYIFRDKINLEAIPPGGEQRQWRLRFGYDSRTPNRVTMEADPLAGQGAVEFRIPVEQNSSPGIKA
jgi:hypothetical protein